MLLLFCLYISGVQIALTVFFGGGGGGYYLVNHHHIKKKKISLGFPGGSVVKSLPASLGDTGSIPGPGRSHMLQNV